MKILFLDFDGVLNSHKFWSERDNLTRHSSIFDEKGEFDPKPCALLKELLDSEPDLRIVVSSSWRVGRSVEKLASFFTDHGIDSQRFIGKTDDYVGKNERGYEIQSWLDHNAGALGVTTFAIVDDDSDMVHLSPRHVKTSFSIGMQREHMERLKALLQENVDE